MLFVKYLFLNILQCQYQCNSVMSWLFLKPLYTWLGAQITGPLISIITLYEMSQSYVMII